MIAAPSRRRARLRRLPGWAVVRDSGGRTGAGGETVSGDDSYSTSRKLKTTPAVRSRILKSSQSDQFSM